MGAGAVGICGWAELGESRSGVVSGIGGLESGEAGSQGSGTLLGCSERPTSVDAISAQECHPLTTNAYALRAVTSPWTTCGGRVERCAHDRDIVLLLLGLVVREAVQIGHVRKGLEPVKLATPDNIYIIIVSEPQWLLPGSGVVGKDANAGELPGTDDSGWQGKEEDSGRFHSSWVRKPALDSLRYSRC